MKFITKIFAQRQARFIFAGAASAGLYFFLVLAFLNAGLSAALSAFAAYCIAFAFGYVSQKYFAFQSKSRHAHTLPRYALVQAACAILSMASATIVEYLGISSHLLVSFFTTVAMGLASYWLSSRYIFAS